ncbi:MAG: hypothetical protein AAGH15_04440 [Myxococcota bacterium]
MTRSDFANHRAEALGNLELHAAKRRHMQATDPILQELIAACEAMDERRMKELKALLALEQDSLEKEMSRIERTLHAYFGRTRGLN